MFERLDVFSMAQALARHGAARQSVIAQNVANADTPGYRARDVVEFAETYRGAEATPLRASRPGHWLGAQGTGYAADIVTVERPGAASPNGNTVSIEQEIYAASRAKSAHDRALAIYGSAMKILRTSVTGRG